jgi:hypothetical protein
MRTISKSALVLAAVTLLTTTSLSANTASPARADNSSPSGVISGGTLSVATFAPTLSALILSGANQAVTGTAPTWTIVDARGTGAAWTLSFSATDFTSAAGVAESTVRTIPIANNLTITPGIIAAGVGSDGAPVTNAVTVTAAGASQSLIASVGAAKGTFTLVPFFSMNIPANSYRSNNKVSTTSAGGQNPFTSTITYTIQ